MGSIAYSSLLYLVLFGKVCSLDQCQTIRFGGKGDAGVKEKWEVKREEKRRDGGKEMLMRSHYFVVW